MQIDTTTAIAAFYPPLQPPPAMAPELRTVPAPTAQDGTTKSAQQSCSCSCSSGGCSSCGCCQNDTIQSHHDGQPIDDDNQSNLGRLTAEEQREVEELRARDREVRAHEQAHIAAGGRYVTRAASYEYTVGPDGQQYAVAGEVSIDTAEVPDDPQATIEKGLTVVRAALAPADPSPQDQRVAAEARMMVAKAQAELIQQQNEERSADADPADKQPTSPEVPQHQRLEQRFAEFFIPPSSTGLNLFA